MKLTHLLRLMKHVCLGSEMLESMRTGTWTAHAWLHAHHGARLRNVRSIRTRYAWMHTVHLRAHWVSWVWTRPWSHGLSMRNSGLLQTTRMMRVGTRHHLDLEAIEAAVSEPPDPARSAAVSRWSLAGLEGWCTKLCRTGGGPVAWSADVCAG